MQTPLNDPQRELTDEELTDLVERTLQQVRADERRVRRLRWTLIVLGMFLAYVAGAYSESRLAVSVQACDCKVEAK